MANENRFMEAFESVEGCWSAKTTDFVRKVVKRQSIRAQVENGIDVLEETKKECMAATDLPWNQWLTDDEVTDCLEYIWHMEKILRK
jgi:hypothetical protein